DCNHVSPHDVAPNLPIELAQEVLVAAIRSTRILHASHDGSANLVPYLNVLGPRSQFPNITYTAINKCWWIHLDHASERGNIDLANLLVAMSTSYPFRPLQYTPKAIDLASANGHLDMLKWWTDVARGKHGLRLVFSPEATCCAKSVAILDWWETESGLPKFYPSHCVFACRKGDLDLFHWWSTRADCGIGRDCYHEAIVGEHHHMLEAYGPGPHYCHLDTADEALELGDVVALQWLADNTDQALSWGSDGPKEPVVVPVFKSGKLEAVKWVLDYLERDEFVFGQGLADLQEWAELAAGSGSVDLLEWVLSDESGIGNESTRFELKSIQVSDAIGRGHIPVLEWCLARGYKLEYDAVAFVNRVEVLQWLKQHDLPLKCNIAAVVETACRSGAIDVLRFWHEHQPDTLEPTRDALAGACYKDQVDVFRFLSTIPTGKSVLAKLDEPAFRQACLFGATRVLQWWLHESGVPLPLQELDRLSAQALQSHASNEPAPATRGGDVQLRSYYNVKTIQFDDCNPRNRSVLDVASMRGDIGMLDWWKQYISQRSAGRCQGHLAVLEWWQASGLEAKECGPEFELTWAAAKWWEEQGLVGDNEKV
ncbi:hypothetical protein BCR44DRAFT_1436584, partial [Catenaria anguillulae PL171]